MVAAQKVIGNSLTISESDAFLCSLDPSSKGSTRDSQNKVFRDGKNLVEAVILPYVGEKAAEMVKRMWTSFVVAVSLLVLLLICTAVVAKPV